MEKLRSGEPVLGKEGILTPLLKMFLEEALEGELSHHLETEEKSEGNRRNGHSKKQVKTSAGGFELLTPRDRAGEFEPQIVKKREVFLGEDLEEKILRLYARGMSYSDIEAHMLEIYGLEVGKAKISEITDKVLPVLSQWQSRRLESVYAFCYLDAIHFKVRDQGRVVSKAVYNVIGVDLEGQKDLLGLYLSEKESATFWLSVLSDLQARGVEDILIACIDNLTGFAEAIASIFPKTEVQLCIVHQIRNSLRYVTTEDQKLFLADLKAVYQAPSREQAAAKLEHLEEQWGKKYPVVLRSWRHNWEPLTAYFAYPRDIRRVIYTNNAIESFHRQIRKHTKSKSVFPSDQALLKLVFLLSQNIIQKWTMPLPKWALTIQQLSIIFGDRVQLKL